MASPNQDKQGLADKHTLNNQGKSSMALYPSRNSPLAPPYSYSVLRQAGNVPPPIVVYLWMFRLPCEMTAAAIHHGPAVLKLTSLIMTASACFYLGKKRMSNLKC